MNVKKVLKTGAHQYEEKVSSTMGPSGTILVNTSFNTLFHQPRY